MPLSMFTLDGSEMLKWKNVSLPFDAECEHSFNFWLLSVNKLQQLVVENEGKRTRRGRWVESWPKCHRQYLSILKKMRKPLLDEMCSWQHGMCFHQFINHLSSLLQQRKIPYIITKLRGSKNRKVRSRHVKSRTKNRKISLIIHWFNMRHEVRKEKEKLRVIIPFPDRNQFDGNSTPDGRLFLFSVQPRTAQVTTHNIQLFSGKRGGFFQHERH